MGRRTIVNLLVVLSALWAIFLVPAKTLAIDEYKVPDVIFYEIMWAGSDEWLVLYNTTDHEISIDDWLISRKACNSDTYSDYKINGQIEPYGYFLISGKDKETSILNIDPDLKKSISLCNSNLKLNLYTKDKIMLIDTVDDGTGDPVAGSNEDIKASMQRDFPIEPGELETSWHSCESQANLDPDISDRATPKAPFIKILSWPDYLPMGKEYRATIEIEPTLSGHLHMKINNGEWEDKDIGVTNIKLQCSTQGNNNIDLEWVSTHGSTMLNKQLFCYTKANLIINEIMPRPKSVDYNHDRKINSQDEWIEIYNPTNKNISLERWQISDSGNTYEFNISDIIKAKNYLILPRDKSDISLNDTGDELLLMNPEGDLVSKTKWTSAVADAGWGLFSGSYLWTAKPTPGSQNIYLPISSSSDQNEPKRPEKIKEVNTGEAQKYINQWVIVEGEVVETSGNTFYLDDGSGKIKIYIQEKTEVNKPKMHKGNVFRVVGLMNIYQEGDEPRLLPREQNDIELIYSSIEDTDESEDNGSVTGSEGESSSRGKAKSNKVITTKKVLGGQKLLAAALYSSSLPKISIDYQSSQNSSPLSPLSPTNKILVETALGSIGLLTLARIGLTMVSLLL